MTVVLAQFTMGKIQKCNQPVHVSNLIDWNI